MLTKTLYKSLGFIDEIALRRDNEPQPIETQYFAYDDQGDRREMWVPRNSAAPSLATVLSQPACA